MKCRGIRSPCHAEQLVAGRFGFARSALPVSVVGGIFFAAGTALYLGRRQFGRAVRAPGLAISGR